MAHEISEAEVLFVGESSESGDGSLHRHQAYSSPCHKILKGISKPCLIKTFREACVPKNCKEGALTLAVVNLFILAVALAVFADNGTTINDSDLCQSEACLTLAAELTQNMNNSVDPCDDFYEYACGAWNDRNPIPDDKARYSSFAKLTDQNQMILRRILDRAAETSSASNSSKSSPVETAVGKAVAFYSSCINLELIEAAGIRPIENIISKIQFVPTGGLDAPIDLPEDRERLSDSVAELHALSIYPFFYTLSQPDNKNSSQNVLSVSQSGLTLPSREYYVNRDPLKDKTLLALSEHIATMFAIYANNGAPLSSATAISRYTSRAKSVMLFEAEIAQFMLSREALKDPVKTYNVLDVATDLDMEQIFEWNIFLKKLFGAAGVSPLPRNVVASSPDYLSSLDQVIRSTRAQTLLDYLKWRALDVLSIHLTDAFVQEDFAFQKEIYGVETQRPQWKKCVSRTDRSVGFALGSLYVKESFVGASQDTALEMIRNLKAEFISRLDSTTWMDDSTRDKAKVKADAMAHKIGYPRKLATEAELDNWYADLTPISADQYAENVLSKMAFSVSRNLRKLWLPVNRWEWEMTPSTVNAYYNPSQNEIVFPAGILQPPFFEQNYPKASNFGGIGVVIGHELTHGFDDTGAQYDEDGNLHKWWSDEITSAFKDKTKCIKNQYSEYILNGEQLNGELTLGENIADNGGLVQAFGAYRAWVKRTLGNGKEEKRLPGPLAALSPNQLFFLSFANVWCGDARPEEAHRLLLTDPHSPGKYRVLGTLSNSKDFAQAFQCKAGSRMNPAAKCEVW